MKLFEIYWNITFIFALCQMFNVHVLAPMQDHAAKIYYKDKCISYGMQFSSIEKLPNGLYDFKCK